MSDGIERLCNQHPQLGPLRQIGSTYVCVDGHACPVDWHVKTTGLPYSSPVARRCPITGTRLLGSGEILQCPGSGAHQEHEVSTRLSDRPAEVAPVMPRSGLVFSVKPLVTAAVAAIEAQAKPQPQAKEEPMRQKTGQIEHGTITMYQNYRCRCAKCVARMRDYAASRAAAKKAKKQAAAVAPTRKVVLKQRVIRAAAAISTIRAVEKGLGSRRGDLQLTGDGELSRLAARIEALRAEQADVETAFAKAANRLMASHRIAPVVEAGLL